MYNKQIVCVQVELNVNVLADWAVLLLLTLRMTQRSVRQQFKQMVFHECLLLIVKLGFASTKQ